MVEKSWSTKEGASWHKGVIYDAIIGEWIRAGEGFQGDFLKGSLMYNVFNVTLWEAP